MAFLGCPLNGPLTLVASFCSAQKVLSERCTLILIMISNTYDCCVYLFPSTLLYSTILYSTLLYSTLLSTSLRYPTLLYSTLLYSTLLYSTRLCSSLRHIAVYKQDAEKKRTE